jgi:uncharacterized protein (DUF362 family)
MTLPPTNRYVDDQGRALVSVIRLPRPGEVKDWIASAVQDIGGFGKAIRPGEHVLVKPNFNAAGPPPVSTDLAFLGGLIKLLYEHGASRVTVGESSRHPPTSGRRVMEILGVFELCRKLDADVEVFGETSGWVEVPTRGELFRTVQIAQPVVGCDRLVYAGVLKTHRWSRFSMSLKLSVGLLRPRDRLRLHLGGHFQERIAELASAVNPDLVLLDGRKVFIKGGPSWGRSADGDVILASGDRTAVDVAGIRCLQSMSGCNLRRNPWSYRQIKEAVRLGLGAKEDSEVALITSPRHSYVDARSSRQVAPERAFS